MKLKNLERMTVHTNIKHAMIKQKDVDVIVTSGYDEQSKTICQFSIKFKEMADGGPMKMIKTVRQRLKNLGYTYDAYKLNVYEA